MTTRQKKKEAFAHVMENVLGFSNTSPMMLAMEELEYDSIEDINIYTDASNHGMAYIIYPMRQHNMQYTPDQKLFA